MNKRLAFKALLALMTICAMFGFVSQTQAQSTTDGAIDGTVVDAKGAVIQGATITVTNEGTAATTSVSSDAQGYFRVIHLSPASYLVTITASGFSSYKAAHTTVQVGSTTSLQPHLSVGGESQTVTVTGEAPLVNTTSPEVSSTINQKQIDNLPTNGGRWSNFAVLTPGVVNSADGFGLISFRGVSQLLNNVTVDGADNNQAYFSEERGRTRAQYSTSEVAVQEFQVNTSNYSSEYGRSAGGVINTVTKSGTNQLHGQLFFRDRDNDWAALNPYTTLTTQSSSGAFVTNPYGPKDWRKQWGFGVGGPILRDRLFWFYAYDQSKRNFPGTSRVGTPSTFFAQPLAAVNGNLPAGTYKGAPISCTNLPAYKDATSYYGGSAATQTATQDACNLYTRLAQSNYAAGVTLLNQGLADLNSGTLGAVPRTGDQIINFPKLDWQITSKHHASFEYNRMRWDSPAGIQTQSSNTYGRASFGNDYVKGDWGVAKLDSTITSTLLNEIRFQYGRDFEFESSQVPTAYETPFAGNKFGRPASISIDGSTGFQIGKPAFLERKAYPEERRIQVADSISWLRGNHTFKFGIDYNRVLDYINNLYTENGSFSYSLTGDYLSDYYHAVKGLGPASYTYRYNSFSQAFGPAAFQMITSDYAGFFEDDWKILPRLTLNLGVRYEYESIPNAILPNASTVAVPTVGNGSLTLNQLTKQSPNDKNNFGPRIGFAWDVFGNARTTLRGGYGLYYGRIINSNILTTYLASGNPGGQITYSSIKPSAGPAFPNILTSAPTSNITSSIAFFDKHFQAPQIHEIDLTVEQNVGWNTVFSIGYVSSLGRELINGVDKNYNTSSVTTANYTVIGQSAQAGLKGARTGPLTDGSTYTTKLYTNSGRPVAGFGAIVDVLSNVNSNYHAMIVQLNHSFRSDLQFNMNYTWSKSLDFNQYVGTGSPSNSPLDPANQRADYGLSSNDVRGRFVLNAIYTPTFEKVTGWQKKLTDGWGLSGMFQAQAGLPFTLATNGTTIGAFSGPLGTGISRLPYMRNTYNYPGTAILDSRLTKRIIVREGMTAEVFGEMFNALNKINITGVSTTGYTIGGTAAAPTLTYNANFGSYQNANSNFVFNPRQVQLGARFNF